MDSMREKSRRAGILTRPFNPLARTQGPATGEKGWGITSRASRTVSLLRGDGVGLLPTSVHSLSPVHFSFSPLRTVRIEASRSLSLKYTTKKWEERKGKEKRRNIRIEGGLKGDICTRALAERINSQSNHPRLAVHVSRVISAKNYFAGKANSSLD